MNEYHGAANTLLKVIGEIGAKLASVEEKAQRDLEAVRLRYEEEIKYWKGLLLNNENDLIALMKRNVSEIFDGKDQVNLERGILLHGKETKVQIPRDALEKIEKAGWDEAVKVEKSVNREIVEKWPEERLVVIGAKKKKKETFNYELQNKCKDKTKK